MTMEMTFGERLRLLRENADLNQTQLGKALNLTQRKESYMETDRYEPSLEDMRAICRYFRVSADYLLGLSKPLPYPGRKIK